MESSDYIYREQSPGGSKPGGEIVPPWVRFPTYERYTIGWRMGLGEDWLGTWWEFVDALEPAPEVRMAYLRRHPPAPVTWADAVYHVLHPEVSQREFDEELAVAVGRREMLRREGLIGSDAAYRTWLEQRGGVEWPWAGDDSPETAARCRTRLLWFWSRQVADLRGTPQWVMPEVPAAWAACAEPLATGVVRSPDVRAGLLTLARMLSAGRVVPPWQLGLGVADFADTFDDDMGYADAFRNWGMSAFDDREQLEGYLREYPAPADWARWCEEQFQVH